MNKIFYNKLFNKIFLTFFTTIIFITLIFSIYFISKQKESILKSFHAEALSMAEAISFVISEALILDDGAIIIDFNTEFLKSNESLEEIIISKTDKTYFIIGKNYWEYVDSIDKSFLEYEKDKSTSLLFHSPTLDKEVFHFVHPLVFSDINWGWMHLSLNIESYNEKVKNMYVQFFLFLVLFFFVSIFVSYIIARSISSPIIALNTVAKNITEGGDLELRSDYISDDEVGELAYTFNKMMSRIQESQNKLENINDKLEEQVALRTNELEELNKGLDNKVKTEIEKRKKQESLLIEQSRLAAIGEMIGNIAHQWRQPLSVITTAVSGMKIERELGLSNTKEEDKKFDIMLNSANYLSQTIEDFRSFFKSDKELFEFNIEDKLEESLALVSPTFKFHHIEVKKNFKNVDTVLGYPNEFSQAVLNILSNAKDALVEKNVTNPLIVLDIFSDEKYVILEIQDNAGGIDEKILNKIFEPYFTTKHPSQGTGIGLYMSKIIIEQNMKGILTVKNGKEGASFSIKLKTKG